MESMRAHFEREAASEGPWTGYNSSLSRPLLNSAKFLEKKPPRVAAVDSNDGSGGNAPSSESPTLSVDPTPGDGVESPVAETSEPVPATSQPEKF
jgi:hypothetical protein